MDATVPLWLFALVAALPAVAFAVQKAVERENGPGIVPLDDETLREAVRLQGERIREITVALDSLTLAQSKRDAELADALERFARMTQRLAVRADRDKRNGADDATGNLDAVLARRRL